MWTVRHEQNEKDTIENTGWVDVPREKLGKCSRYEVHTKNNGMSRVLYSTELKVKTEINDRVNNLLKHV